MITVLTPGLLTTVQDLGRPGYQQYGIVVGGIYVMTAPKSQGPAFVSALGGGVTGFAQAVTGQAVSGSTSTKKA